ncbi:MAG: Homing endonuclease LAGLIDADG/HNH [Candidatus Magasanikbacteria bacterium]|nr:Homing endonuclease LAGLIDADG/HNH [Candidatus Magasanikbacteria bacterium]
MSKNKWLKQIPLHIGWYISGFTDGEGSFNVSVKKVPDHRMGWKLAASFNVSQLDQTVLIVMKRYLGCGTLRERKDGVVYYEVTSIRALYERIIPFFLKFRFFSATKKRNFLIFQKIIRKMFAGEHHKPKGFNEIMKYRAVLNEGRGRKRKYDLHNVHMGITH